MLATFTSLDTSVIIAVVFRACTPPHVDSFHNIYIAVLVILYCSFKYDHTDACFGIGKIKILSSLSTAAHILACCGCCPLAFQIIQLSDLMTALYLFCDLCIADVFVLCSFILLFLSICHIVPRLMATSSGLKIT